MTTLSDLWTKLRMGRRYRAEFATQFSKQAIAHQIDSLLTQFDVSQTELGKRSGISQGVVSRAANPLYGNLTINTLVRIAAGLDLVFVGAYVPFSELPGWLDRFYSRPFTVPPFEQEDAESERADSGIAAFAAQQQRTVADSSLYDNVLHFFPTARKPAKKSAPHNYSKLLKSNATTT